MSKHMRIATKGQSQADDPSADHRNVQRTDDDAAEPGVDSCSCDVLVSPAFSLMEGNKHDEALVL